MSDIITGLYRRIFARKAFRPINSALFHLSLRGLGILNFENPTVSGEIYFINKILPQVMDKEAPVFFDIGANIGRFSTAVLNAFPNAAIHAFEPHPRNFAFLKANLPEDRVECHNLAVGDARGELTLYDRADAEDGAHASLYEAAISEIHKQRTVEYSVSMETLDQFCEERGIKDIDLIKIDTEGGELSVLRGAKKLIQNGTIKCVHFEFNEMNIVSRCFLRDFRNVLRDFRFHRLLPNGALELNDSPVSTEIFGFQNIVAARNDISVQF